MTLLSILRRLCILQRFPCGTCSPVPSFHCVAKTRHSHPQLRHLVSAPRPNCLYFVHLCDVYRIDTITRKRSHIAELTIETRCTDTGHGFFCAGGEDNGYFASIKLPELETSSADVHHARETSGSDRSIQFSLLDRTNGLGRPWQRPRPHIERLGEDIVNSISIHRLAGNGRDLDDDVVAILTNNDKTVRMYSLKRNVELKVDVFGFMMNHATISPDGKLLVIVGDRQEIFFNRRVERSQSRGFSPQHGLPGQYDWEQIRHFPLYKPQHAEYSAYFTTAWSPDGKLCATASEDGYITVFDVDAIANDDPDIDPVVAVAPSSRKDSTPGAVRTMCFAPEPWDLLIWAEQNGRVCVGDLRQGLLSRQVVELNPKGEDVTKLNLTDTDSRLEGTDYRDLNLDLGHARRQHRSLFINEDSHRSSTPTAQDLLDAQERRHLQREMGIPELDGEPQGLNEEERAILEGLRTSRQREEAITLGQCPAASTT